MTATAPPAPAATSAQGPRPTPLPAGLRWLGPPLAAGYGLGVALRRLAYATGLKRTRRASLPVLGVGNLTAGGTGKTPFSAYLAKGLLSRGLAQRPAILMRGYGADAPGEPNDEALELIRGLGEGVPVICNPDRLAGTAQAASRGCDLVVLDDGFQHWQLARALDIVLVDATDPFGGGHLLPWGRLRESPAQLARAGAVVLTRADLIGAEQRADLEAELQRLAPQATHAACRYEPARLRWLFAHHAEEAPGALAGRRVLAVCGLGNPQAFFTSLERLGARLADRVAYPDHFDYRTVGLRGLERAATRAKAEWIVVTEKDAAKLEPLQDTRAVLPPVFALGIACHVETGEDALWQRIAQARNAQP